MNKSCIFGVGKRKRLHYYIAFNLGKQRFAYKYEYDASGNITKIYKCTKTGDTYTYSSTPSVVYTYDNMNQLTKVDDYEKLEQYTYTYDSAGNITRMKHYGMITIYNWVPNSTIESNTYTYGDSSWGDLLTAYNGQV